MEEKERKEVGEEEEERIQSRNEFSDGGNLEKPVSTSFLP